MIRRNFGKVFKRFVNQVQSHLKILIKILDSNLKILKISSCVIELQVPKAVIKGVFSE